MNDIGASISGFFQWWGGELRALVPARAPATGRNRTPRLVLEVTGGRGHVWREANGMMTPLAEDVAATPQALAAAIATAGPSPLPVVVRVPIDDCLERIVPLPVHGRDRFPEILKLDLERATPFRASDVLTAFIVPDERSETGLVAVRHLVLRRDKIDHWLAALAASGHPAQSLDCWDAAANTALPVDFLAATSATRSSQAGGRSRVTALLGGALVLATVAGVTWSRRQAEALDTVRLATVSARETAMRAQRSLDGAVGTLGDLAALRALSTGPASVSDVLDTLTRLIPDQAFVQDLRIDGGTIELSGLAQTAAVLLPILERAPLFTDAAFTAPVLLDPTAGKERFTIRLKIRGSKASEPPRAGGVQP